MNGEVTAGGKELLFVCLSDGRSVNRLQPGARICVFNFSLLFILFLYNLLFFPLLLCEWSFKLSVLLVFIWTLFHFTLFHSRIHLGCFLFVPISVLGQEIKISQMHQRRCP